MKAFKVSNRHSVIYKGLLGVLCILCVMYTNSEIVLAESTVNDLRNYLNGTDEKIEEEKEFKSNYNDIYYNIETELDEEKEYTSEIDMLNEKFKNLDTKIVQEMDNGMSAYDIMTLVIQIKTVRSQIEALGYKIENIGILKDTEFSNVQTYKSENDINSEWYNIGDLGDELEPLLDNFKIYSPYGYEIAQDANDKYKKISDKQVSLKIVSSESDPVKSIFNGKIMSIQKGDIDGLYNISINNSNGLYTVYKNIKICDDIKKGDMIEQYGYLGESGKNFIEFEVILDNKNINPLLLFGSSGKHYYENFVSLSSKEYAVGDGESYYYTY